MKRSEFKAIVKECLLEIFGEVLLSETNQRKMMSSAINKGSTQQMVRNNKRSLNSLMQKGNVKNPNIAGRQPIHRQHNHISPPTMTEMILSAKSTMEDQNSKGEMSARPMEMLSVPGGGEGGYVQEGFDGYGGAYGNAPIPQSNLMNSAGVASIGSGADIDGDSHWATVAFFDEQ